MNVSDLLAKADKVSPRVSPARKEWLQLFPVVEKLMRNGLAMLPAVRWLIEQDAILQKDESRAYQAFHKIKQRREKR